VDVGEHTISGNGDADKELAKLLLVAHGKLHMARYNATFLVVAGGVASELGIRARRRRCARRTCPA